MPKAGREILLLQPFILHLIVRDKVTKKNKKVGTMSQLRGGQTGSVSQLFFFLDRKQIYLFLVVKIVIDHFPVMPNVL